MGFGSINMVPSTLTYLPAITGFFSVHSLRNAWTYSSVTAPRSLNGVSTTALDSASNHPAPMPTVSRPPDR